MKHSLPALALTLLALAACVPSGSSSQTDSGPSSTQAATATPTFRPSTNVMTAIFEDNFDRAPRPAPTTPPAATVAATTPPTASSAPPAAAEAGVAASAGRDGAVAVAAVDAGAVPPLVIAPILPTVAAEAAAPVASGADLGPDWFQAGTDAWRIEDGKLCGAKAHNHPVWMKRTLPVNARIEFDAISESQDGDLKAEFWGDGKSFADPRSASYNHATSYLTIFGGWKNKLHALARIDEHGSDRKLVEIDTTSDDPKQRPVVPGQTYHFKIERTDGRTVRWYVDGLEYLAFNDAHPLVGDGHDHFGFNDWEAKVCFDNVKVTPL